MASHQGYISDGYVTVGIQVYFNTLCLTEIWPRWLSIYMVWLYDQGITGVYIYMFRNKI